MNTPHDKPIQGSLFEENYLLRSLGSIAINSDMALTELVANSWDAGASFLKITIPTEHDETLIVEDDGTGMTPSQFKKRWMTLGYDRVKHQGNFSEFPKIRNKLRRRAYGRNGVGRHSLLCFNNSYKVETIRDGKRSIFVVSTTSGKDPFVLLKEQIKEDEGYGTKLYVNVKRNLPDPERIRNVLSGRFISDPQFKILVNGISVNLTKHEGLLDKSEIKIDDDLSVEVLFFKLDDTSKRVFHHGIAFWVGGRLVGEPSWTLADRIILDGRTRLAKRHTIVVRSDMLFDLDLIHQEWSGFKQSSITEALFSKVADYVEKKIREIASDQIIQTKEDVLRQHRPEIEKLKPLARREVSDMAIALR